MEDWHEKGQEVMARLWGQKRAQKMVESLAQLSPGLQGLVLQSLTYIYERPALDARTRFLCNVAALTALGKLPQLRLQIWGALNNGATREEVEEVMLQMALYSGLPSAIQALEVAKEAFAKA